MDTRTGEIVADEDRIRQLMDEGHHLVPIDEADMTPKQRREGKVSLKDHRSKLGKVLTANQRRHRRRKLGVKP